MSITITTGRDTPRVLFAERNAANRTLFEQLGERFGWVCEFVVDAAAALHALKGSRFDVLVTDLVFPQVPPAELLRQLRDTASDAGGQRVIVLTPREHIAEAADWIRDGATDVLVSPIDIEELGAAVQRVVEDRRPDVSSVDDPSSRYLKAERGVWEISSLDLARMKFPFLIVERLFRAGRVDKSSKMRLELAFQEALLNALDHGNLELDSAWREEFDGVGVDRYSVERRLRLNNPKYANRKIVIETILEGVRLSVRIRDEGRGFTPRAVPTLPTQPLCSGRGLAIIKGSVDEVHFAHHGTEITLIKFLPS